MEAQQGLLHVEPRQLQFRDVRLGQVCAGSAHPLAPSTADRWFQTVARYAGLYAERQPYKPVQVHNSSYRQIRQRRALSRAASCFQAQA